jgi:2-desacetyl-2-hydroxyethyl bacteriochlorophyllide A dehydrogenase
MTQTMPASVYVGDGAVEVQDVPVPELGPGDALVAVSHCGICGTDLHLVLEGMGRPGSGLGHEWAGTLAAVGGDVTGWELGARVVAAPKPGCGECRACRRGRPSVCLRRAPIDYLEFRGAFARYIKVEASRLLRVPESLSTRAAALTEPTAVAMHAVTLSGAQPGDRVLVTGGGPVGLLVTAVLVAKGIDDVTVSEPAPLRRAKALAVGARAAVEPDSFPSVSPATPVPEPFQVVFECSGRPAACEVGLTQLDYAGTFVFVGTGGRYPTVNHNRAIVFESTIVGAFNYDEDGFAHALDLLASGRMPLDELIEPDDVPLDGLLGALQRCAAGELSGKVMIVPEVTT